MPVVSPSDTAAIKEIVKRNLGPQIFAFSRCMVDDVKRAVDCGVSGIVMEVPSSTHIIEYAYKWPLEKAIDLSIESTAYAHAQGLEVVFFPDRLQPRRHEVGAGSDHCAWPTKATWTLWPWWTLSALCRRTPCSTWCAK